MPDRHEGHVDSHIKGRTLLLCSRSIDLLLHFKKLYQYPLSHFRSK